MMKLSNPHYAALLMTMLVLLALPARAMAAQPTVNLGTTSSFAVLAGSTITNTGPTTVDGNAGGSMGLDPGTSFPGQAQVTLTGVVHLADSVASIAKHDLVTAYNDAAGRTPVTTIPTELGGRTLTPGVYDSSAGTFQITGTLTLDAQGDSDAVFIFKTASTLITASDSKVSLINSARPCRVFWKVGSSATLGTDSHFVGHIFALTSITANTGATVQGQLLARNGAVTLDTNIITNAICSASSVPAIYVSKTASPNSLVGAGTVTYTYVVTNAGNVPLSNVGVTDDKVSPVTYVSGDTNSDHLLQPGETWIYTATATLSVTTSNTATATGGANGTTATASAGATVGVTPPAPGINITKAASPNSLVGTGAVTYTYVVTNVGNVPLGSVSVADDKVSPVTYVSGDTNNNALLQLGEKWIYTAAATLSATTSNTATATGGAYGTTVTASAVATVVVTPPAPAIRVAKTASPGSLRRGAGWVTFTYRVTNPGNVTLSGVSVTDDKISKLTYVSGDTGSDRLLRPGETWVYTGREYLRATTTNVATARGTANGIAVTGAASTVVTGTASTRVSVTGGPIGSAQIPKTATPYYNLLVLGVALALAGVLGYWV